MSLYSLHYNTSRRAWIARISNGNGTWSTKQLPKALFNGGDRVKAERWLMHYIAGNVGKDNTIKNSSITVKDLGSKWLKYRYTDNRTKVNYYRSLYESFNNWVLDSKLKHFSVEHLDLETEYSVDNLKNWIDSLEGAYASRLVHINTFKQFFNDIIALGWINPEATNPFDKPAIKRLITELKSSSRNTRVIVSLSFEQAKTLLESTHPKIRPERSVKYALALLTGARVNELHGLTWEDVDFNRAVIHINRQLIKPGCLPLIRYEDCIVKKMPKNDIYNLPNAIYSNPKRNSFRVLPLHPLAMAALELHRKTWKMLVGRNPNPQDPIFPRDKYSLSHGGKVGDFITGDFRAAGVFRKDLERLNLPSSYQGNNYTFHALRRTFASLLEGFGAEESRISTLLGHGSRSVARNHYLSSNIESLRNTIHLLPFEKLVTIGGEVVVNRLSLQIPALRLVK